MKTSEQEKAQKNHLLYDPNATTLTEKVDVYSRMYQIFTFVIYGYLPCIMVSLAAVLNSLFLLIFLLLLIEQSEI
jgi:hypothetical protein